MSKKNFEYNLELKFRYKIYEVCKVLVNDISPVVKELELFVKNVLLSPTTGDSKITYRIKSIELYKETKNDIIKEFEWSMNTNQFTDSEIIELDINNIDIVFKENKKDFMTKIGEEGIDFPESLYGKIFICFAELLSDYLIDNELIEKRDIFNILTLDNNGDNNIIY